jgi:hypothetical protein
MRGRVPQTGQTVVPTTAGRSRCDAPEMSSGNPHGCSPRTGPRSTTSPYYPARTSEAPMVKVLVIRRKRTVKVHRSAGRPVTIAKRGVDIAVRKNRG